MKRVFSPSDDVVDPPFYVDLYCRYLLPVPSLADWHPYQTTKPTRHAYLKSSPCLSRCWLATSIIKVQVFLQAWRTHFRSHWQVGMPFVLRSQRRWHDTCPRNVNKSKNGEPNPYVVKCSSRCLRVIGWGGRGGDESLEREKRVLEAHVKNVQDSYHIPSIGEGN